MKIVFNPRDELRKIQGKYPFPNSLREHSAELIAAYGKPYFNLLVQEADNIQRETRKLREFAKARLKSLQSHYEKGKRYAFVVTGRVDNAGHQLVRDSYDELHTLISDSKYSAGDEVKCTVSSFSSMIKETIADCHLVLTSPRIVQQEEPIHYLKAPSIWSGEVQDLGKHKCGKPFTCSCCGRSFPANAGWRVDLKDIYFCNSCAKKIYDPKGRGNRHFIISTPMGNKR